MNSNQNVNKIIHHEVQFREIDADEAGQRLDNFLLAKLKGVPKSLIYRIIRKGEVRINKGRTKPEYKLAAGDIVRIPPIKIEEKEVQPISQKLNKVNQLESQIIFEDDYIIVLNKPSGLAVHGGSGLQFGAIEALRALRPQAKFLELVHRLDKDTSGLLLIAKKRSTLKHLHDQLRMKKMQKHYLALVRGIWPSHVKVVQAPLLKNLLQSGERVVKVSSEGKPSETHFKVEERLGNATLVRASPITGRTHQIRVHTLHAGHPIALDPRYGDIRFDEKMQTRGLNRLFLHAASLVFIHPHTEQKVQFSAPLDDSLKAIITTLREKPLD
ncbi:23S rRNA pseudouridine(955/2504/2580) synthase RluC [Thorsellia kenyensis]|uniref:Pseudouridine synthase n=1 Tax=Thorsellia kenyensis TaxID=1549888 RepID=A0ABV6C946_9GAMM